MGGENIGVAELMWSQPHRGTSSVIMGRSVHNQCIERLWCDVFQGCTVLYYHLFMHLESVGLLDPSNEAHLFALHYVYLSQLQKSFDQFRTAYIHHPLSFATKLFFAGLSATMEADCNAADLWYYLHRGTSVTDNFRYDNGAIA